MSSPRDDESDFDEPRLLPEPGGGRINVPVVIASVVVMTALVGAMVYFVKRDRQVAAEAAREAEARARDARLASENDRPAVAPPPRETAGAPRAPEEKPIPAREPELPDGPQLPPPKGPVNRTKPAAEAPRGRPGENWEKLIGTWRREPIAGQEGWPVELDFRADFTATSRVIRRDGSHSVHETRVEVQGDAGDRVSVVLHLERGRYFYSFTANANGTLTLMGIGGADVDFVRVKSPYREPAAPR
jgi:hypothetical protein